jgi:hypothetical protein
VRAIWWFLNQPLVVRLTTLPIVAGALAGAWAAVTHLPWLAWSRAVRHWPLAYQALLLTAILAIVVMTVVVLRVRVLNRPGPALPVVLVNSVPLSGPGPSARYRTQFMGAVWHWRVPVIDPGHDPIEDPRNHDFRRLEMDGDCPRCPRCESELDEQRSFWGGYDWRCLVCLHRLRRQPSFAAAEAQAEKHARGYLSLRYLPRPPAPGSGQSMQPG